MIVALLTPEQCRAQCRVSGDYDDEILADKLASAEDAVAAHLNRNLYADQNALDAAVAGLTTAAAQAQDAYDDAVLDAASLASDAARAMALQVAEKRLADFGLNAQRTLNGIVANGSILAAVRLTLGHLYANRESVATGVTVTELPLGVADLLRPYRLVMMP